MKVSSDSFEHGAAIPADNAFGEHDPENNVALCANRNPHIAWSEAPEGTQSFALICHDVDVPTKPDDVNQEGKRVPADLPRADFYHWVLVDIAADKSAVADGSLSDAITARGKSGPDAAEGMRQGINDYTSWFAGDDDMRGTYYGYDGPCPPWNDTIVHHYYFTVYALDIDNVSVDGDLTGPSVRAAIEGHVLDKASLMGTYTIAQDAEDKG